MKSYAAHNRPLKAGRKPQVRPQPKDPQMINKMDFFNPMKLGEKLDDWEYESGDSSSIATLLRRFVRSRNFRFYCNYSISASIIASSLNYFVR
jgi:hypothetical protein